MIPLEDNFTDVLGKALRGQNLSVHAAATRAGTRGSGAAAAYHGGG